MVCICGRTLSYHYLQDDHYYHSREHGKKKLQSKYLLFSFPAIGGENLFRLPLCEAVMQLGSYITQNPLRVSNY